MVNAKNVAFKVDKQGARAGPPPQPFATVINCRKPKGKRAMKDQGELKSQQVPLTRIPGALPNEKKRKRSIKNTEKDAENPGESRTNPSAKGKSSALTSSRPFPVQQPRISKPTRLRGKAISKHVDMDCWYIILSFTDPGQLLAMRNQITPFYRVLRDHPKLWKLSREFHDGEDMPDPPSVITELQFADLRHGHGCMSCGGAPSTRKTYWAFLRRWCKPCFQSKVVREDEVGPLFRSQSRQDDTFLKKCLHSGTINSWCNFVGVGPARTHSLKTVYLVSEIERLVADFQELVASIPGDSEEDLIAGNAEIQTWVTAREKIVEERREFARKMEFWEDRLRASRTQDYQGKKNARKWYFIMQAAALTPPITALELEQCPAYRRAIVIPKEPNQTSWNQLLPKLEKEVVAYRERMIDVAQPSSVSIADTTTSDPDPDIADMMDML
jgi:hypothetical protein